MTTDEAIEIIAVEMVRISPHYDSIEEARQLVAAARKTIRVDPARFVEIVLADFASAAK